MCPVTLAAGNYNERVRIIRSFIPRKMLRKSIITDNMLPNRHRPGAFTHMDIRTRARAMMKAQRKGAWLVFILGILRHSISGKDSFYKLLI